MSIEIVVNKEQAISYIQSKRESLVEAVIERVNLVNQMMADRVKANLGGTVLQARTGKLLDTVQQVAATLAGNQVYGAVTAGGPEAPYGIYFEQGGTHSYQIRPVNARVLAFMGEGGMIFARLVNHPPTPKLPWFQPEADTAAKQMQTGLQQAFNEVLP